MSKVKKYSRQLVVLFLVLATALTCMLAFSPDADAGATAYKWRVSYQLDQGNNNTESCYVDLYYKTNNGTGTEKSVRIEGDDITFDKGEERWYYWTSDSSIGAPAEGGSKRTGAAIPDANAFPTKVVVYAKSESGSPAYQEVRIKSIKLEVFNQNGTVLATSNTADLTIPSSKDTQERTATVSIGTGSYPYVQDFSVSGTYPVYIARDGSSVSQKVEISAVDNYGVNWVNGPTTTGTNITVSNGTTTTPTFTFANQAADYTGTITCKWTTGNTNTNYATITKTASTDVYVPHSLTVDTNGGSYGGTNPITGKYTNEKETLAIPTRAGYTFSSWTKTAGNGTLNGNDFTFGNNSATVKANWTPVGYSITPVYDSTTYPAVAYNIETTSISLPTPTRTGYTFAGWAVSSADGNWKVGDKVTANPSGHYGNITVAPTWTANNYTLNFNPNKTGAQCDPASKTVAFDAAVGELPVPTLTAYDFAGWFTDAQAGTQVNADTVYTTADNSTVYAHWTPRTYKIITDENGGNTVADGSYNIEAGSVPAAGTRTGYTFSHWEVAANSGNWVAGTTYNPGQSAVGKYGDVTLKAVWVANDYTLNFDLNKADGAVTEPSCDKSSISVTFDSAVGTLPVPTLDGYDFAGWFTSESGGTQYTASTVYTVTDDFTVYAQWTPHTYSIVADANGGNAVPDSSYTIIEGTIPVCDTRTGYTFSHWEVAADAGNWVAGTTYNPGDSTVGKYGDVTLKAVWTTNNYNVYFNLNDTTGVGSATADKTQITVTYDSALNANEALPVATRNGYNFLGWFTQAEGGEQITESLVYKTDAETTYYAHWEVVTYTLSFDTNNGDALDPITYTVEDSLTLPEATRTGYTFTSWFYGNVSTGSWKRNTTYNADALALGTGNWGDVTIKANYTVIEYTITWIINGTEETSKHAFNTVPTRPDPEVKNDPYYEYEFTGWDPVITVVSGEATYTATFIKTPKAYRVTWVDSDGNELHSGLLGYGEAIPTAVLDVPAKTGYTGEWDYSGNTTMPAENLIIRPVYTPVKYPIHWEADGVVIKTDMVAFDSLPSYTGSTPTKAEDAMYTYTFKAWTPAIKVVDGEATYVAEFTATPKEYTVEWVANGSTVISYKLAYGSAITNIPKVPEILGMVGSWEGIPETMPANDITINAKYVKGCLVTWYLDGTEDGAYYQLGFANGEQIVYDRSNPEKPADAEYTYKFEGWSATVDGELIAGYPIATETDLVYYAVYSKTPNEYTIIWEADGVEVLKETLAFGSDITNIPEVPAKTGHTGVWSDAPATMPSNDVKVVAEYTPIDYTITWVIGENSYETTFAYGTKPSCSESTDKASTLTTDYTFAGWDKTIVTVEGDETYTAVYTESARKYTVTWEYEDGTLIDTDSVANGAAITYIPEIAAKEGHDYTYELPEVMPTNDITIVVKYEAKSYTITWSTPSGTIEETWKYGETPVYDTDKYGVPTKEQTAEKQFTFSGWNPSVSTVKGNATYVAMFTETARKYTVVWYVDGEFYETRDIAFGGIIPTLPIPEKAGYTGIWDNPYRTMPARDLTINATYTAKKYTVYWKVDGLTVYSASVSFGDMIPTQKVPEKVGCTGVWVNVPDTMPAENITIVAEYTPKEYTVTWRFDGETHTGTATYGVEYTLTFVGESLPEGLKITIGGIAIGEEQFTYNPTTGELIIPGSLITGDVSIIARAAGGNCNLISNLFGGTSSNDVDAIPERTAYFTILTPDAGYLLPSEVSIYVDGVYLAEGYTYETSTGRLVINAEVVMGEIEIYAEFPEDPNYNPDTEGDTPPSANCSCNCHSKNAFTKFFFDIITWLRKLFGMEQYRYCGCGAAHW